MFGLCVESLLNQTFAIIIIDIQVFNFNIINVNPAGNGSFVLAHGRDEVDAKETHNTGTGMAARGVSGSALPHESLRHSYPPLLSNRPGCAAARGDAQRVEPLIAEWRPRRAAVR